MRIANDKKSKSYMHSYAIHLIRRSAVTKQTQLPPQPAV